MDALDPELEVLAQQVLVPEVLAQDVEMLAEEVEMLAEEVEVLAEEVEVLAEVVEPASCCTGS